ncbi:hypothetical protein AgCh_015813 [Apium graveolens]
MKPIVTKKISDEDENTIVHDEPLSPAARLFRSPEFNLSAIIVLGFNTLIDADTLKYGFMNTLAKHPRFASLLVSKAIIFSSATHKLLAGYNLWLCGDVECSKPLDQFAGTHLTAIWERTGVRREIACKSLESSLDFEFSGGGFLAAELVTDDENGGQMSWRRTKVDIDEHVYTPDINPNMELADSFVEEYISDLTTTGLNPAKPLWEQNSDLESMPTVPNAKRPPSLWNKFNVTGFDDGKGDKSDVGKQISLCYSSVTIALQDDPLDYVRKAKAIADSKKLSFEAICSILIGQFISKFFGFKVLRV